MNKILMQLITKFLISTIIYSIKLTLYANYMDNCNEIIIGV